MPSQNACPIIVPICRQCGRSVNLGVDFCCSGCEVIFNLSTTSPSQQANTLNSFYAYCDDPSFITEYSVDGRTIQFALSGLDCVSCLWLLEKLPQTCPAVSTARLSLRDSILTVKRNLTGQFSVIASELHRMGFDPKPIPTTANQSDYYKKEIRTLTLRLGIAAVGSSNIMLFSIAQYAGAEGIYLTVFSWLSAIVAMPVLTFCAWPIYKKVWKDLEARRLSLDAPIAAALLSGTALSLYRIFNGDGAHYFDSLTIIVFLLLGSRFLLRRALQFANDSSAKSSVLPVMTVRRHLKNSCGYENVSSTAIKPNDEVEIDTECIMPFDGRILSGSLVIDQAVLNGEPLPIIVDRNKMVLGGVKVLSGKARIRVEQVKDKTYLSKLLLESEKWSPNDSYSSRQSEIIGKWFVGIVMSIAFLTLIYCILTGIPASGIERALAIVLVSCPCVFAMAIPLANTMVVSSARRRGLLVRQSRIFEMINSIQNVFFDKTGTLTKGKITVLKSSLKDLSPDHLEIIYHLEKDSSHPVARALIDAIGPISAQSISVAAKDLPQGGRVLEKDGHKYKIVPLSTTDPSLSEKIKGTFGLYENETLISRIELVDELRSSSIPAVATLKAQGLNLFILTGDSKSSAKKCATLVGINNENCEYSKTPTEKMERLKSTPNSLMIGDGVNDAGALNVATVGVAIGGALAPSLRSASVYLMNPDLNLIPYLFSLAAKLKSTIHWCLVFSVAFNMTAVSFAVAGQMSPLLAAILMPASSLSVLTITLFRHAKGREL